MSDLPWFALLMRWVHILSASLAIGVPIFMRFVFQPVAVRVLPAESAAQLRQELNSRWFKWVNILILLFLITGLYNFIVVVLPLNLGSHKALYHMIFGFKMILALGIFFLASALAGKSSAFAFIRTKTKLFLSILVTMLIALVILSGVLRSIRDYAMQHPIEATVDNIIAPLNR